MWTFGTQVHADQGDQGHRCQYAVLERPAGRSRLKVALVSVGSSLYTLLGLAAFGWPIWSANHDHLGAILFAVWVGCVVVAAAVWPHAFAQSSLLHRRYHEEWAHLDIT
jgi:hypothetical protein